MGDAKGTDETLPVAGAAETLPATASGTVDGTTRGHASGDEIELPEVDRASYELRELLGSGGMGKVVVARDKRLGRLLAVKVAKVDDPGLRVRFTREAVLTARLQHPSIIPVHEAGVWPGDEPFYAMKLVAGAPLAKLIAKTKTLDDRLALIPNVIAVVDALAYAHSQRVIHRDLKPDNVIVGEYGETIVIDWGLAKELDSDDDHASAPDRTIDRVDAGSTVEGAAMGTPPYMAPEQARGERLDERADVYGLGAMLYHVLCGQPPYNGANAQAVMDQVEAGPPRALGERQNGIPADLLAIVDKAMARDKAQRYENAKQLADDLKRFERGQLVAAHAYSRGELIGRWLARHKLPVAITAMALVAIAIATTLWMRGEFREREMRGRRTAELLHSDESDYNVARTQMLAGDFADAQATMEREVLRISSKGDADIERRHAQRLAELERITQIASFHAHARNALFLFGDEDQTEEAIYEIETALKQVGAIDENGHAAHPKWNALFMEDLQASQRKAMQQESYRLVMSLALLHFKQANLQIKMAVFMIAKSPEAAAHFRAALDVLSLTDELEQTLGVEHARVARIFQKMSLFFLQATGTEQDVAAVGAGPLRDIPPDPALEENSIDDWFLGVAHLLVFQTRDTAIGKGLRVQFPDLFDYTDPLGTGERLLRAAIRLDPTLYWPHYMLARTLRDRGDLGGAELELDACILLAPDYMLAYTERAFTLGTRAMQTTDPNERKELIRLAFTDAERTVRKEPNHPVTFWGFGDLMKVLDHRAEAIEMYTEALEVEDHILDKFSRQLTLPTVVEYVKSQPYNHDDGALVLLAFAALAQKQNAEAIELATRALALRRDVRPLTIRGHAYLQEGKLDKASADFGASFLLDRDYRLATLGFAQVTEKTSPPSEALAAWDNFAKVAISREQTLQAHLGRYRALTALGRVDDAKHALAEAASIAHGRPLPDLPPVK
jgi:tetratricopeptide (TPR) repeat protein